MSEYKEGDLVEAVKGDTVIRGRLDGGEDSRPWVIDSGWSLNSLVGDGFTVSLVESAPTPLPTASGFYVDEQGDHWRLNGGGGWDCLDSPTDSNNPQHFAPFTRLEPVPDVARTVLERVRELLTDRLNASAAIQVHSVLHVVELENGVTS